MRIDPISPQLALSFWYLFEPLVDKLCKRDKGEYTPEHVKSLIENNKILLWVATNDTDPGPQAIAGTHVEFWPNGEKVFRVLFMAARKLGDWEVHLKTLMDFARDNEGCQQFITEGRKGWARRFGWKPESYVYKVELT